MAEEQLTLVERTSDEGPRDYVRTRRALLGNMIRRQRIEMIESYVCGDVLEIGCHDGATLARSNPHLRRYVGTDIDDDALKRARSRYPSREFLRNDIDSESLGFNEEFDVVLMVALIEHILNQRHLLEQCHAALRPGGLLVVTTPTPFGNDLVHRIGARFGLFHRSVEDHHVVIYDKTRIRAAAAMVGYDLWRHRYFQFGCNQLAVLKKRA